MFCQFKQFMAIYNIYAWRLFIPPYIKITFLFYIIFIVTGCGLITAELIYEGIRTQQTVKGAVEQDASEKMKPYDVYEKEREVKA